MVIVFLVGAVLLARQAGKEIDSHLRDDAEKPAASGSKSASSRTGLAPRVPLVAGGGTARPRPV